MNTKAILAVAAVLLVLGAGYAVARPGGSWNGMMGSNGYSDIWNNMMSGPGNFWNGMMSGIGHGFGMMGGYGNNMMGNYGEGYGNGMMYRNRQVNGSWHGGMMRTGGMMGRYGNYYYSAGYGVNASPITIEDAKKSVEQYLASIGNSDLNLAEVIQFDNHFYAGIKEKSTGKYAFELIVNKFTGQVLPEMGPNMMWNAKYGHMNIGNSETNITREQALKIAQGYLNSALPGTKAGDADTFYGYYTIEVTKDGAIYGMLSVKDNTGAVWYHNWHGTFEKILEVS